MANAMGLIADFVPYAELKGAPPVLPDAGTPGSDAEGASATAHEVSPLGPGSPQPPVGAGQTAPARAQAAPKEAQEPAAPPPSPPIAQPAQPATAPAPASQGPCGCKSGDLMCTMKCSKGKEK